MTLRYEALLRRKKSIRKSVGRFEPHGGFFSHEPLFIAQHGAGSQPAVLTQFNFAPETKNSQPSTYENRRTIRDNDHSDAYKCVVCRVAIGGTADDLTGVGADLEVSLQL